MTAPTGSSAAVHYGDDPDVDSALRTARREWWRNGVRRADRRTLGADLAEELYAAGINGSMLDVTGDDVAVMARDWAIARGMANVRLRLALILPLALVAGVLASGAVLAMLGDAFTHNGGSLLERVQGDGLLLVYVAAGLVAYLAMVAGSSFGLVVVHDERILATAQKVAAVLPLGAVVALVLGVGAADHLNYATDSRTFVVVAVCVLAPLALAVALGRWLALHQHGDAAR